MATEFAWRGSSHWTMFLAGGVCLCLLDGIACRVSAPLPVCAALGAVAVTGVELAAGLLCTRLFHLKVWDYSREWGNLGGLICPKYTVLWFFLCWFVLWVMQSLRGQLCMPGS